MTALSHCTTCGLFVDGPCGFPICELETPRVTSPRADSLGRGHCLDGVPPVLFDNLLHDRGDTP